MQPFAYVRPGSLAEAVAILDERHPDVRVLAGGTDLVIRLRDGSVAPSLVVDVKRIPELAPGIRAVGDRLVIGATTVMTDIAAHPVIRREVTALAEAAAVVGSAQIRNRATLGGNLCNASPAADTAPPLLVHGAVVVVAGPGGTRRLPLDELFVRSGVTTLGRGELLIAIELPIPVARIASAHQRRTRRRGHDLASVTLSCGVDRSGVARIAYGSVGPRPVTRVDASGTLADPAASAAAKAAVFEAIFADASPSARSMRAGPEYRLAMLRVLGRRALATALERLDRLDVGDAP
jgi:CO/xanthine dehydrogenase FAD-binding subunit